MFPLLNDPKPTVVRQCLKALHELVMYRLEMSDEIIEAIKKYGVTARVAGKTISYQHLQLC